jgi:4-diphosphocytidyl-2-C-methyl-D-erythritol kinase
MSEVITVRSPAKVNLLLRVLAREADGYHSIETLLTRVDLADTVAVRKIDSGIELSVEGAELGPAEQNLAWRAADAVLAATGRRFGVSITLVKRIPAGGGLGGGSSNAAAVLRAVNRLAGNAVPAGELMLFAHRLGSDVPFFLTEAPAALGWGRGQRLLALPPLPAKPLLLLFPGIHVATADAYRWVDEQQEGRDGRGAVVLDQALLGSWGDLARISGNDFEAPVFRRHQRLRDGFEALARTSPLLCRMSGSGSTLFAVYRDERSRADAMDTLGGRFGELVNASTDTSEMV